MIDFLTSDQGLMLLVVIGIGAVIAFIVLSVFEAMVNDDFDPVIEAKCKNCVCYSVCLHHGRDYECRDYMTDDMLRQKGLKK